MRNGTGTTTKNSGNSKRIDIFPSFFFSLCTFDRQKIFLETPFRLTDGISTTMESTFRLTGGVSTTMESTFQPPDGVSITMESTFRLTGGISRTMESTFRLTGGISITVERAFRLTDGVSQIFLRTKRERAPCHSERSERTRTKSKNLTTHKHKPF